MHSAIRKGTNMKHSKSSLFLMELIIAILFFSLASAVCIQMFAKAHLLSAQTVNQNNAVIQAQNLAEVFLSNDGDITQVASFFDNSSFDADSNSVTLFFDEAWNPGNEVSCFYSASLTCTREEQKKLLIGSILVRKHSMADIPATASVEGSAVEDPTGDGFTVDGSAEDTIYSLEVVHHVAGRRSDLEQ